MSTSREDLIESCIPMVYHFASRLNSGNTYLDYTDIVSEGYVGLVQAANAFDDTVGASFSSFAAQRIRGAMIDAIRAAAPLSRKTAATVKQYEEAVEQVSANAGRSADDSEIAVHLNIDVNDVKKMKTWNNFRLVSLDDHHPDSQSYDVADDYDLEDDVIASVSGDSLRSYIDRLMPRDRAIIDRIYFQGYSQRSVAQCYNISESRLSQVRRRALESLRSMIDADGELAVA
jgi:RNA polymerase sigma factor for flagellar operon FliA